MIETKEIELDGGITLRVTPHKGRPGARLAAKLMRLIGPLVGAFRGKKLADVEKMELGDIAPMFLGSLESLSDASLDELLCAVFSRATIVKPAGGEGGDLKQYDLSKPSQIDDAFEGEFSLLFRCAWKAVEVNFGGFFAGSGQSAGGEKPPTEGEPPSA